MTLTEVIEQIKKDGEWTEDNLSLLSNTVAETDFESYTDPSLKKFMSFINDWPYHEKIQEIVTSIMIRFMEKGIMSPCGGACGTCAFHEMEFGA